MSVLAQDELDCQSVSSSSPLTIKGVQDNKVQCSYLQKECLHLVRLIPFLLSGFQVTNILFKLTPSVPRCIKLGLRLTEMMNIVSRYSERNQENCDYNWRSSYLAGVYQKHTVAFHVMSLVIVVKQGAKPHKHGEKEIHMDTYTPKHTTISLPSWNMTQFLFFFFPHLRLRRTKWKPEETVGHLNAKLSGTIRTITIWTTR